MWMEARAMRNTILRSGYGVQQALSTDFARLEQKVALSLGAITEKMDLSGERCWRKSEPPLNRSGSLRISSARWFSADPLLSQLRLSRTHHPVLGSSRNFPPP